MKRKITHQLNKWHADPYRKPLVLYGARQTGKTYSLTQLGQKNFADTALFDFEQSPEIRLFFEGELNPKKIVRQLSAWRGGQAIQPEKTLIIFDEIQRCGRALTSLKYFYEQAPEYCIAAAGSLLGVHVAREQTSYPVGKVDMLTLHPLDFEEFLWSQDEEQLAELIRESYENNSFFPLAEKAMELLRSYWAVGGLPEPINRYSKNKLLFESTGVLQTINKAYIGDMTKYADAIESSRLLGVWDSIPQQLAKTNHKFQYQTIAKSARAHQYQDAIEWLEAAQLVSRVNQISAGQSPLKAFENRDSFKLYLLDTGLLSVKMGAPAEAIQADTLTASPFKGALAENYVMQQLASNNISAWYWGTASKHEVDFIIVDPDGNAIPAEVKYGTAVKSTSLNHYRNKYNPNYALRFSQKNFGFESGIRSIPLYAAFCVQGYK